MPKSDNELGYKRQSTFSFDADGLGPLDATFFKTDYHATCFIHVEALAHPCVNHSEGDIFLLIPSPLSLYKSYT